MTSSTKRPRSASLSSSDSSPSLPSRSSSPATKYIRFPQDQSEIPSYSPVVCTLPPTCSLPNRPTHLNSLQEAESHYANYHTHVCEYPKCRCVFPDTRLLELHILECHDPITALRKERGEKTFACFLGPPTCTRVFSTPKGRRLHLVTSHNYPKQYFFGVVNKGIGGLLKKWGPAVSLYRGEWKARKESSKGEIESEGENNMDTTESLQSQNPFQDHPRPPEKTSSPQIELHHDVLSTIPFAGKAQSLGSDLESNELPNPSQEEAMGNETMSDLNDVSMRMASLSLIPNKVRFGRGGKGGGFVRPSHRADKHITKSSSISHQQL